MTLRFPFTTDSSAEGVLGKLCYPHSRQNILLQQGAGAQVLVMVTAKPLWGAANSRQLNWTCRRVQLSPSATPVAFKGHQPYERVKSWASSEEQLRCSPVRSRVREQEWDDVVQVLEKDFPEACGGLLWSRWMCPGGSCSPCCSRISFSPVLLRRRSGREAVWVSGTLPKSANHSQFSFYVKPQKYWCSAGSTLFPPDFPN